MAYARYDGLAEWYEKFRPALNDPERDALERLLGGGTGRCLDVGCGTGLPAAFVRDLGWAVIGVDVSSDLLDVARDRGLEVVHADAAALPFDDGSFDASISVWTHTDVEDFAAVLREVARVLRPAAPFVYIGAHPCFVGPHSHFPFAQGVPTMHPGYREVRRYSLAEAAGIGNPEGLRARVGAVHLPLGIFVDTFAKSGFVVERFEELGDADYPFMVALRCRRYGTTRALADAE